MEIRNFLLLVFGIMIVLVLLLASPVRSYWGENGLRSFLYGAGLSAFNIAVAYLVNRWAFARRQGAAFVKIVLGGMAVRFLIILVALYIVWEYTSMHLIAFVSALMGFYVILQIVEIGFIQKKLIQK